MLFNIMLYLILLYLYFIFFVFYCFIFCRMCNATIYIMYSYLEKRVTKCIRLYLHHTFSQFPFSQFIEKVFFLYDAQNKHFCLNMFLFYLKALRHHEGNEAQVCFFIIQLLLLTPSFKTRVNAFVREVSKSFTTSYQKANDLER